MDNRFIILASLVAGGESRQGYNGYRGYGFLQFVSNDLRSFESIEIWHLRENRETEKEQYFKKVFIPEQEFWKLTKLPPGPSK